MHCPHLVGRTFLMLAFIQLCLEYQSIHLFLWPLNHSCAKPAAAARSNATPAKQSTGDRQKLKQQQQIRTVVNAFADSRKNPVNEDAIQTNLFDAYLDDPYTLARALSMGIKYDDVAGCLQYRREFDNKTGTSSVDLSQLETCPNGLHFEEPSLTHSVLAVFKLACARQYLRISLPNSLALGLIVGTLLTAYNLINSRVDHQRSLVPATNSEQAAASASSAQEIAMNNMQPVEEGESWLGNLYYWFLVQMIANIIVQIQTYSLGLSTSADSIDDDETGTSQHPDLLGQFVCSTFLRSFITGSNLIRIVFVWPAKREQTKISPEFLKDNHRNFLVFSAIFICFQALYAPVALRLLSGWWELSEWLAIYSLCLTIALFVRELLLDRANDKQRVPSPEAAGATNQLVLETNVDDCQADLDCQATRTCEFCSLSENPISFVDNPYAPTTTQQRHHLDSVDARASPEALGRSTNRTYHHTMSFGNHSLLDRNLIIKATLLTFCLSFNYFLFQMLPNHKLLHSETASSRLRRKTSYAEIVARERRPSDAHVYVIENSYQNASSTPTPHTFHDQESFINRPSQMNVAEDFDFRSFNRATRSIDAMKTSLNPIEILWTTASLNRWPLDLIVFCLHLRILSNFEFIHFKLNRKFVLVELGAKFLALEWLVIGIVKRQNHLLEWEWLNTTCLLAAHLSSSLILFNYINSMLKLNSRLVTNKLMLFLPNTLAAMIAFLVASYAPLLEWFDLVIIPVMLIVVELIAIYLIRSLSERFRASLCPMIFENRQLPNGPGSARRMVLVVP